MELVETQESKKTYTAPRREAFAYHLAQQIMGKENGTQADAYFKAGYKAKTRKVAKSYACRLKNHPEVKKTLKKLRDYLEEFAPAEERAKRIAEIALDKSDKRACLEANKQIAMLREEVPVGKLKVQQYTQELDQF